MTLKTSLIITGDSATAQKAVAELNDNVQALATSARGAIAPTTQLSAAERDLQATVTGAATATTRASAATAAGAVASRGAAVAQGALATATGIAATSMTTAGVAAGALEAILTGGLSIALTLVVTGASLLAGELLGATTATDQERVASGALSAALDELSAAQQRSAKFARDEANAHFQAASAKVQDAIRTRELIKAKLASAIVDEEQSSYIARFNEGGVIGEGIASARADDLRRQLAEQDKTIAVQKQLQRRAAIPVLKLETVTQTDPAAAAARRYEVALTALDKRAEKGTISGASYRRELARLNAEREAATSATARSTTATTNHTRAVRANAAAFSASGGVARDAADAQRQLAQDLETIIGKYDPARKAASDYADEIERIGKLQAGGLISADEAARYTTGAASAFVQKRADSFDLFSIDDIRAETDAIGDATGAIDAMTDATREAEQAKRQLQGAALDALDAIIVGGEKAGDVIKRLAGSIASAALEATLFGTGPLAALLKGGVTGVPKQGGSGAVAQGVANTALGDTIGKSIQSRLDRIFGTGGSFAKTLQNAGIGYTAGGMVGSGAGGAIGGILGGKFAGDALGKLFPKLGDLAGPLGSLAGGLLGGVVGALFKSSKTGSATIGNVGGVAGVTGAGGNNAGYRTAASGLAGGVNDQISAIVAQLGGSLGNYAVSIGKKNDRYVVDTSGRGSTAYGKSNDGITAYATAEEAQSAALRDAILDGAIGGLSAAMEQALRSSPDVNRSVSEALKVQQVETLIGGIGGEIEKAFKDFEATAKERVRIARDYGFDVVAIEKRNAADRNKIAEDLLKGQVGSLKQLVDEVTRGSLFEGSSLDKLGALDTAIAKAKADLDAGVDGAGDTLATLFEQRLAALKTAYGTTGAYASGRDQILDQARAAIAKANERIVAAQAKTTATSDPALQQTNAYFDENNDQNARLISAVEAQTAMLSKLFGSEAQGYNLAELARV